jgi:capsid protein
MVVPTDMSGWQGFRAYHYDVLNRWNDNDHWAYADQRSATAHNSTEVRNQLASAARFEYSNNSYCHGVVDKLAYEVVGTGPRLEIEPLTPSKRSMAAANTLEERWAEYTQETGFVDKLILSIVEEVIGGECFNMFRVNRSLRTVQVDFEQYEGIQFQSDAMTRALWDWDSEYPVVDGLRLDRQGNVVEYHKMRSHPGSNTVNMLGQYDEIPADYIVHLYRKSRPSQYRGISHLAPCIELFGKLRRYTEATIETAENAASMLGTIETAFQPNLCTPGSPEPISLPFGSGQLMTLPDGWKYNPYRPEQPTTVYGDFKREILHEVISCLLIPWNIAASDSSDFNFASGQLDHRIFDRYVKFQRERLERVLINRFLNFWLEFATITPGVIPTGLGAFRHKWYWPNKEPIDPSKVANANKTLAEANLLDETQYWQERGSSAKDAINRQIQLEAFKVMRRQEVEEELGIQLSPEEPDSQGSETRNEPKSVQEEDSEV